MAHRTFQALNVLPLCFALAACGGSEFGAGGTAASEGDGATRPQPGDGDAGVTPGTGGASGAAGSGTAGAGAGQNSGGAGSGSGGSAGSTGGAQAATGGGGSGTGGQAAGGTGGALEGDAGPGTGAAAGTGGTADGGQGTACKPPVIDDTNMPSTVVWDSYLGKSGTDCLECLNSPCATCKLYWFPVTQSADGLTVTGKIDKTECPMIQMKMGPCDNSASNSQCAVWTLSYSLGGTITLNLEPKPDGTGYRVAAATAYPAGVTAPAGTCPSTAYQQAHASVDPADSAAAALHQTLTSAEWGCGQ